MQHQKMSTKSSRKIRFTKVSHVYVRARARVCMCILRRTKPWPCSTWSFQLSNNCLLLNMRENTWNWSTDDESTLLTSVTSAPSAGPRRNAWNRLYISSHPSAASFPYRAMSPIPRASRSEPEYDKRHRFHHLLRLYSSPVRECFKSSLTAIINWPGARHQ